MNSFVPQQIFFHIYDLYINNFRLNIVDNIISNRSILFNLKALSNKILADILKCFLYIFVFSSRDG